MSDPLRSKPKWHTSRITGEHFMPVNIFHTEPKFIFIHIPKSAGSSVQKWLHLARFPNIRLPEKWDGKVLWNFHTPASVFKKRMPNYGAYYKFAFVRNPWDRMLSMFKFHQTYPNPTFSLPETFAEYVKTYNPNCYEAGHLGVQVDYITNKAGKRIVDFVGRFENFQEDLKVVAQHINIDLPDTMFRENTTERDHYRQYYTNKTKDIVGRKFAQDIEYFGYEF